MDLYEYMQNKIQFNVEVVESIPENYYDAKSWDSKGVYYNEKNNCLYFVSQYSVDTIYNPSEKGLFKIIERLADTPKVEESLLLKVVAAAHGHHL